MINGEESENTSIKRAKKKKNMAREEQIGKKALQKVRKLDWMKYTNVKLNKMYKKEKKIRSKH